MNIVEAWGSGIPKMFREAKEYGLREPELIDMGSDFRINLYRKKAAIDHNGVIDPKNVDTNGTEIGTNGTDSEQKLDVNEKAILQVIQHDPKTTQKDICAKTGIPLRTVKRTMSKLQKSRKLRREGTNRNGLWVVINQKK